MKKFIITITLLFCVALIGSFRKNDNVLYVYTWTNYMDPEILKQFEQETGIKVVLDTFDSNEVLEAKLLIGNTGYDVVFPTARPFFLRQKKISIFQKLDRKQLPNIDNLDLEKHRMLTETDFDECYGVPYLAGTSGIGYNLNVVKTVIKELPEDKSELILNPIYLAKLSKHGIGLFDSPTELLPIIAMYLGFNPNTTDPKELQQIFDHLRKIRPYIAKFSDNHRDMLANGELCAAQIWSGDLRMARDNVRHGVQLEYALPPKGAILWADVMAIPIDAIHVKNAHAFINFFLRPDIAAKSTIFLKQPSINLKAIVPDDLLNDIAVYPPKNVHLFVDQPVSDEMERYRIKEIISIRMNAYETG